MEVAIQVRVQWPQKGRPGAGDRRQIHRADSMGLLHAPQIRSHFLFVGKRFYKPLGVMLSWCRTASLHPSGLLGREPQIHTCSSFISPTLLWRITTCLFKLPNGGVEAVAMAGDQSDYLQVQYHDHGQTLSLISAGFRPVFKPCSPLGCLSACVFICTFCEVSSTSFAIGVASSYRVGSLSTSVTWATTIQYLLSLSS